MQIDLAPIGGFEFSARIECDDSAGAPWQEECGHGPVSDWRRKGWNGHYAKAPGELLLCDDNPSGLRGNSSARFYDYQEACRIALRDNWGIAPYHMQTECNANGIYTVSAQWFHGRELLAFKSTGDCVNAAIADCYRQHKETFPSARAYAAGAARADFERLREWCNGDWQYVGLIVDCSRNGIELASASLWGIESDSGRYLEECAQELAQEALQEARERLATICDCEPA